MGLKWAVSSLHIASSLRGEAQLQKMRFQAPTIINTACSGFWILNDRPGCMELVRRSCGRALVSRDGVHICRIFDKMEKGHMLMAHKGCPECLGELQTGLDMLPAADYPFSVHPDKHWASCTRRKTIMVAVAGPDIVELQLCQSSQGAACSEPVCPLIQA